MRWINFTIRGRKRIRPISCLQAISSGYIRYIDFDVEKIIAPLTHYFLKVLEICWEVFLIEYLTNRETTMPIEVWETNFLKGIIGFCPYFIQQAWPHYLILSAIFFLDCNLIFSSKKFQVINVVSARSIVQYHFWLTAFHILCII